MIKNLQIKAMNEEEAKKRALNILEAQAYQITDVKVLQKPKSFFGLFSKMGIFEIFVDPDKKKESPKVEKKEKVSKPAKAAKAVKTEVKKEVKVAKVVEKKVEKVVEKVEKKVEKALPSYDILEKVETLIHNLGLSLEMKAKKVNDKHYKIELVGEDNGIIIGKKGKTLHSLEYLLNSMYKEYKIEIDVEGFKAKRSQTLRDLAKKMAEKCIRTKKVIRLNSMPAKERKIIHEILNTYPELETYSEGRDPKRYIVIKYKRK